MAGGWGATAGQPGQAEGPGSTSYSYGQQGTGCSSSSALPPVPGLQQLIVVGCSRQALTPTGSGAMQVSHPLAPSS